MDVIVNVLQTVFAFILVLAPLVFVHELGHFAVAKMFRIGVPVFSLGFGPRLFGFKRGETDYRVSAVPLGGYVRLAGDESDENRTGAPEEFLSRPKWQRFFVFVAGAAFNVITAFLALWLMFAVWGKQEVPAGYPIVERVEPGSPAANSGLEPDDKLIRIAGQDLSNPERFMNALLMDVRLAPDSTKPILVERDGRRIRLDLQIGSDPKDGSGVPGWQLGYGKPAVVVEVVPESPAERAGLLPGDRIVGAEGQSEISYVALRMLLIRSPEKELHLDVEREGRVVPLSVTPRDEGGQGKIGAALSTDLPIQRDLGVLEAAGESARLNLQLSQTLLVVLKRLFSRELPLSTMSGPIGIAKFAHEALLAGAQRFIWLLGFFSLQLGILNLLPIPVLDGGHILILGVEGILRRDLSERVKERIMQVGFVFLLAFMGTIIALDIIKL